MEVKWIRSPVCTNKTRILMRKDTVLIYYDKLTPMYATFYNEDFSIFYQNYTHNQIEYGENHGVLAQPQTPPPENSYVVSCVPWISFNHFAVHSYENKSCYFPSIEAGKFFENNGRTLMPLSITCHHATTDGYHINCFCRNCKEKLTVLIRTVLFDKVVLM